jgi:Tfp pilus assembly protein FimT
MPMGPRRPRPTRGSRAAAFTITELLLVVTIVALVGGVGGGLYVGTYKRLLVEKAARHLLVMARYGRTMAIGQQKSYELQLSEKGFLLTTTQVNTETGQNEKTVVRDYYCRPVEFEGDVQFEEVRITTGGQERTAEAEEEQAILFLPNGSATSALVQIGDGKTRYSVAILAATGKATLHPGPLKDVRTGMIDLDMQWQ